MGGGGGGGRIRGFWFRAYGLGLWVSGLGV